MKPPPIMSPEEIEAQYVQFKDHGFTMVTMRGSAISIDEWRGRELRRWATEQIKKEGK